MAKPETPSLPLRKIDRLSSRAEIAQAAKEIGCDPDDLHKLIAFVGRVEEAATELEMTPPEVTNGCMTVLASALRFCPEEQRPEALTSIFEMLWDGLGLKRDT